MPALSSEHVKPGVEAFYAKPGHSDFEELAADVEAGNLAAFTAEVDGDTVPLVFFKGTDRESRRFPVLAAAVDAGLLHIAQQGRLEPVADVRAGM